MAQLSDRFRKVHSGVLREVERGSQTRVTQYFSISRKVLEWTPRKRESMFHLNDLPPFYPTKWGAWAGKSLVELEDGVRIAEQVLEIQPMPTYLLRFQQTPGLRAIYLYVSNWPKAKLYYNLYDITTDGHGIPLTPMKIPVLFPKMYSILPEARGVPVELHLKPLMFPTHFMTQDGEILPVGQFWRRPVQGVIHVRKEARPKDGRIDRIIIGVPDKEHWPSPTGTNPIRAGLAREEVNRLKQGGPATALQSVKARPKDTPRERKVQKVDLRGLNSVKAQSPVTIKEISPGVFELDT